MDMNWQMVTLMWLIERMWVIILKPTSEHKFKTKGEIDTRGNISSEIVMLPLSTLKHFENIFGLNDIQIATLYKY
jgi:hypothetical protein